MQNRDGKRIISTLGNWRGRSRKACLAMGLDEDEIVVSQMHSTFVDVSIHVISLSIWQRRYCSFSESRTAKETRNARARAVRDSVLCCSCHSALHIEGVIRVLSGKFSCRDFPKMPLVSYKILTIHRSLLH